MMQLHGRLLDETRTLGTDLWFSSYGISYHS